MATFTQLYLTNRVAPYTPATLRGAWDDTAGAVTKALDTQKGDGGVTTTVSRAETNASNTFDVLLYRGVSGPLAAQTISGTLDVTIQVSESNSAADFYWHVHIYVTQGDSDTPRGTLLTDYVENTTNEFSTTGLALHLQSAQTLSSLGISNGDRIVVELGFIARNSVTTSRTGALGYGTLNSVGIELADQIAASVTIGAPFITFSNAVTEAAFDERVTQIVTETATVSANPVVRVTSLVVEVATAVVPNITFSPPAGSIGLTGYAPTVILGGNLIISPNSGTLDLTGRAPNVVITSTVSQAYPFIGSLLGTSGGSVPFIG